VLFHKLLPHCTHSQPHSVQRFGVFAQNRNVLEKSVAQGRHKVRDEISKLRRKCICGGMRVWRLWKCRKPFYTDADQSSRVVRRHKHNLLACSLRISCKK
jgi:hypothetical protein